MPSRVYQITFQVSVLGCLTLVGQGALFAQESDNNSDDQCHPYTIVIPEQGKSAVPVPVPSGKLLIDADSFDTKVRDTIKLDGNVDIRFKDKRLVAEHAKVNDSTQEIDASGNIMFNSEQMYFSGDSIQANLNTNIVHIENADYESRKTHVSGSARLISADAQNGEVKLRTTKVSTCPKEEQTWYMSASSIDLYEASGWGEAKDMALYVKDFPVFYFPALSFPISKARRSGFLYPDVRSATHTGLDISAPYYFNIADNYDATITPRIMTLSGFQLRSEFRFLWPYLEGEVLTEYMPEDKNYNTVNLDENDNKRYQMRFFAQNPRASNLSYYVDFTQLSDDNYIRDLGGFSDTSGDFVKQEGRIEYELGDLLMSFLINSDDTLNTPASPYERLPQVEVLYQPLEKPFTANYSLASEFTYFDFLTTNQRDPSTGEEVITGSRFHVVPRLSFPMNWEMGYIRPQLEFPMTKYEQSGVGNTPQSITRSLPIFSVDSALHFDKYFNLRDKKWLQTLTPRLFFLSAPKREQDNINLFDTGLLDRGYEQLFRNNRFIGYDRIGDAEQLTVALETRFIDTTRNFQTLNARIGRAYYLSNISTFLDTEQNIEGDGRHSPYIMDMNYHINRNWFTTFGIEWEPSPFRTRRSYFRVNYAADNNKIFNITHRLSRNQNEVVEQTDFSFAWPVRKNWHIIGRWQNNLSDASEIRTLETFAGLEYRDCCWSVRLVNRRFIDAQLDDNGGPVFPNNFTTDIMLEFEFHGLTSLGEPSLGRFLENSIYGYEDKMGF